MCIENKDVNHETNDILIKLYHLKEEAVKMKSINKKAYYYAELKLIKDTIELEMEKIKPELVETKVEEYYLGSGISEIKVIYQEGSKITEIDTSSLYYYMKSEKREEELVSILKITETDLKTIKDGEALIARYKKDTGKTKAPSIKVAALSKEDRKRLLEEK